jgi:glutaredoxin-like protein
MFIEPNRPGDPFEVSDADTMLNYINPQARKPDQVAVFTREGCQYCTRAKTLLTELGYDYVEVPLVHTVRSRVVGAVTGDKTVPQIFINGEHIGGLEALEEFGRQAA